MEHAKIHQNRTELTEHIDALVTLINSQENALMEQGDAIEDAKELLATQTNYARQANMQEDDIVIDFIAAEEQKIAELYQKRDQLDQHIEKLWNMLDGLTIMAKEHDPEVDQYPLPA